MMPRLEIRREFGMLSIETTYAQIKPRQTRVQMTAEYKPAVFSTGGRLPKVKIDQTESFASAGNKPVFRMASDNYSRSVQKGIETIGKIVDEGLTFLRIEEGGNPVPRIARQRMEESHRVDLTVVSMPSVRPQIDLVEGYSQLNWSPGELNISWDRVDSQEWQFTPAEINVSWLRRPSIEITFVPGSEFFVPFNTGVGNFMDAAT